VLTTTRQAVTHIWESRWFELMYTLQGKPCQHAIHISRSVRVSQPFTGPYKVETGPYTWKKSWYPVITQPSRRPSHLILPPSQKPWSRREKVLPNSYTTTLVYWSYNTSMRSVCSILAHGANSSVLNWHRWGLQPWRCWIFTSLSPPFPTNGPPLCSNDPAQS
jgi:hypothetical protein